MANFFKQLFDPGGVAADRAGRASNTAAGFLSQRFEDRRKSIDADFQKAFDQLIAAQNPFLASLGNLEQEFRQSPGRQIGTTAIAGNLQARRAGGGRGLAFSTSAAALGQQAGISAGANLGILQQQALQNISALRQFSTNLALPQKAGLISARFGEQSALGRQDLNVQGAIRGAGAQSIANANIAGIGQGLSALGTTFSQGIGSALSGAAITGLQQGLSGQSIMKGFIGGLG